MTSNLVGGHLHDQYPSLETTSKHMMTLIALAVEAANPTVTEDCYSKSNCMSKNKQNLTPRNVLFSRFGWCKRSHHVKSMSSLSDNWLH